MARLLLVVVAMLALLAACGGEEASDDPLAALDTAARKTTAAESNRQQFKIESDIEGEEVSMSGEGTMSADSTRGHMIFEMESPDTDGGFEAIVNDGVMYMKGDQIPLPPGKEWLKVQDPPTSTMSPSEFVQYLHKSGDVENEGTEEIRGEETVHFSGPLDIEKLVEATGGSDLLERFRQSTAGMEGIEVLVDVWVAPDGLPARIAADISAPEQAEGSLKITADILEYNVDVDADPPPASKVATP